MPVQKGASSVIDKLKKQGAGKAFDQHKKDETEYGSGGELPAGLTGIAKLIEAKIDEYKTGQNQGQLYLQFRGVIQQCNQALYVGNQVMKQVPLMADPPSFANPKTFDDRIAEGLNEMRKLGVPTANMTLDDWEAALMAVKQEGPSFKFHTWAPTNPVTKQLGKVKTDFDGVFSGALPASGGAGGSPVVDNTAEGDVGDQGGDTGTAEGGTDWAAIGGAADGGDNDAAAQITARGLELGIDQKVLNGFNTWSEAAAAVAEAEGAAGGDAGTTGTAADEGATAWKPSVGDVYKFKPKGARAAVDCEVTAVFKETLNLKRLDNETVLRGITWGNEPEDNIGGQKVD